MAEHCDHKFIDSSYCAKCGVHVDQLRGGQRWLATEDAIGGAVLSARPAARELRTNLSRWLREDAWARSARGELTSKGLLVALRLAEYAPGPLPGVAELATATGLRETQVAEGLRELEQREMIRRRDGVTAHTPAGH